MYCQKCGARLPEGAKFCQSCGAPVSLCPPYVGPVGNYTPAPAIGQRRPVFCFLIELAKSIAFLALFTGVQSVLLSVYMVSLMISNANRLFAGINPEDYAELYASILEMTAPGMHYVLIISAALTILILVIYYRARHTGLDTVVAARPLSLASASRPAADFAVFALIAVGAVSAQVVVGAIYSFIYELFPAVHEYFDSFVNMQSLLVGGPVWIEAIDIAIITPILEEVIFRGLIHSRLRRVLPKWAATLISSAIFGIMHGTLIAFTYAFALGVLLALLYDRYDSLFAPIVLHMAFNASSYIPMPEDMLPLIVLCAVGTAVLAAAGILLFRFIKPANKSTNRKQYNEA